MSVIARLLTGDRLLFGVLVFVIVWLPWPLGSNRPWSWAVAEIAVFAGLGLSLLSSREVRGALREVVRGHRAVLAFFTLWLLYQWFQTVDLGGFWLARLSPSTADVYASTAGLTGDRQYSVAFDRASVIDDMLKNAFYVGLFLTVGMVVRSRRRLLVLAGVVVAVGVAEACYGLVGYFQTDGRVTSGSFVNRNHYAAFLVVAFAIGLGFLYPKSHGRAVASRGARQRLRRVFELIIGWQALVLLALVVLAAALLLSQSRGALGSLLAGVVLMTAAGTALRTDALSTTRMLGAALLAAAAGTFWFGTGGLGERLAVLGDEGQERLRLWAFTLELIREYPWVGVGADNYAWAIPGYRDFLDRAVAVTHAHNDYLELLAEQGLVGATLAGAPVVLIIAGMLDGYRRRYDRFLLGILFGTLTASIAFLAHAAVEFNFQVPANAAVFFVVLGMGMAAAGINRRRPVSERGAHGAPARSGTSPERRPRTGPKTR